MPVIICMLRGVNVLGRNKIKMDALKALCVSLKLRDPQTFIQSGNVIFGTREQDLAKLARRIQDAIERKIGFRPAVVLRTARELREVIARNPFAGRNGIEPNNLLVTFLATCPGKEACDKAQGIKPGLEEMHIIGREAFIHFPDGQGRSKLSWAKLERVLETSGTGRNWNSVTRMMEIAERLEAPE